MLKMSADQYARLCEMLGESKLPVADLDGLNALLDGEDVLTPEKLDAALAVVSLSPEIQAALRDALAAVLERPMLKQVLTAFHYWVYQLPPEPPAKGQWPGLPTELDPTAGLGYAAALMAGVDCAARWYEAHRIDVTVLRETLSDMALWIDAYRAKHGVYGLAEFNWLTRHFTCRIFSLGRLQFEPMAMPWDIKAYRHRQRGQVRVLLSGEAAVREDGQFDGTNGIHDPQAWAAALCETDDEVRGHVVNPAGFVEKPPVVLKRDEWEEVLRKGDPTFFFHIPATGPLRHDECGESFRRAMAFYPLLQQGPFRAFICNSWLLDSQLETCVRPDSNLARFQKEFYLLPVPEADDRQTLERVFGGDPKQIPLPEKRSSLQQRILDEMDAGRRFRNAGAMLLTDDFHWGGCV